MTKDETETGTKLTLAQIGFGEAAEAFVSGWSQAGVAANFTAFDLKTDDPLAAKGKWQDYQDALVTGRSTMESLLSDADIVFSLVTADQAGDAAQAASAHMRPGTMFFDGNSCAPKTKQANAAVIEKAGGCYVDTAIMAPVHPKLHQAPILLSGPHAEAAQRALETLDMNSKIEPGDVGRASSIKMVRSIMIKGMEALVAECVLAGRRAGVEEIVLDSLEKSNPEFGWREKSAYNLERMMVHGQRRAAEMAEVARTVSDLGLDNGMASATTAWQQRIGDLALDAGTKDYTERADRILAALGLEEEAD